MSAISFAELTATSYMNDIFADAGPPAWMSALDSMLEDNTSGSATPRKMRAAMELGLIVDGNGLKSDGSRGAPQASIPRHEPIWLSLVDMVEETTHMHTTIGIEAEAHGVAAAHSYDARIEAARKLVGNHEALLYDVSHPQPRTQQVLERVPESSRIYADQALLECARRLIGPRPGYESLEVRCDTSNPMQANAWATVWRYLQTRIQSKPEQKPGRPPDMSPEAATAMLAVLEEIAHTSLTLALKHSTPHWLMLHDALEERESSGAPAEGAAAAHAHMAREAAARKLIGNHARVLRDLCNPNPITNIEGKLLTQLELERVGVGCASYADEVLRETARRLLGRRAGLELLEVQPDPSNEAQTAAWSATVEYLCGRLQATDEQKPGRPPDMPPAAAAAMKAVLREVSRPRARLDASRLWAGLEVLLQQGAGFESEAEGAAAHFPHVARQEAAARLAGNRAKVLADICNPSPTDNIYGKELTQLKLERVHPRLSPHVDELMRETVRRLLGKRAGSRALEAHLQLHNDEQRTTWQKAATYLIDRIQFTPEQKPGREPDMSFVAGNATRAVLAEIRQAALTATIAATAPHWEMLRKALDKGATTAATREAMESTALGIPFHYRESAARKLVGNHVNVLRDVCNPSATHNIYGKPLTQLELVRVDVSLAPYADEVLRETARRLLGRRAGLELLEVQPDPSNEAQTAAWSATVEYLLGRIQSTEDQKPGRTPDLEYHVSGAMKATLEEVADVPVRAMCQQAAPQWAKLRRIVRLHPETQASFLGGPHLAAIGPADALNEPQDLSQVELAHPTDKEEAAKLVLTYYEDILHEAIIQMMKTQRVKTQFMSRVKHASYFPPEEMMQLPKIDRKHLGHLEPALRELACSLVGNRPGVQELMPSWDQENPEQMAARLYFSAFAHHYVPLMVNANEKVAKVLRSALVALVRYSGLSVPPNHWVLDRVPMPPGSPEQTPRKIRPSMQTQTTPALIRSPDMRIPGSPDRLRSAPGSAEQGGSGKEAQVAFSRGVSGYGYSSQPTSAQPRAPSRQGSLSVEAFSRLAAYPPSENHNSSPYGESFRTKRNA